MNWHGHCSLSFSARACGGRPSLSTRRLLASSTSMGESSVWKDGGTATGSRLLGIASRCERRLFWPLSLRSETTRVIGLLLWSPRRSRSTSQFRLGPWPSWVRNPRGVGGIGDVLSSLTLPRRRRASWSPSGGAHYACLPGQAVRVRVRKGPSAGLVLRGVGRRRLSRASRSLFGGRSKDRRDYSPRLVTALDALPSVLTAFSSSCSETRSVGQARTRRRRPSQWTTMTRVAALLRAPPGRRFTRSAPGSVTFVSRSTRQPWKTARPLTSVSGAPRILAGLTAH